MDDIITDIDMDAPEDEYVKYYDYCLRVGSIADGELKTPNYEYWRRVYAGQAMQGIVSALDMNTSYAEDGVASMACDFADALIEELDRRNTK